MKWWVPSTQKDRANAIPNLTYTIMICVYRGVQGRYNVTTLQLKNIGLFMNMNATENNVYAMQKDYGGEMRKIEVIF